MLVRCSCNKVYYILHGACGEMFHGVYSLGNRGLKVLSVSSAVCIMETYPTLPAGKETFTILKKLRIFRWINNIGGNLSLNRSGSPENDSSLFRKDRTQKSIVSCTAEEHAAHVHNSRLLDWAEMSAVAAGIYFFAGFPHAEVTATSCLFL